LAVTREINFSKVIQSGRLTGLWRLMAGYRFIYSLAALSIGLSALGKTTSFYLIRFFVDDVLGDAGRAGIIPLVALGFVGLALLQGGFSFLSGRLSAKTAESVVRRLRNYLYDHIQRLSFGYHDRTPTGDLIQRTTSDVEAIRLFYAEQALSVGRTVFLFIINMTALLSINVRLALYSVIVIPFIVGISIYFFSRVYRSYSSYQEQEAKLSTTLQENLTGIRVVKAFGRKVFEIDKFETQNMAKYIKGKKLVLVFSLYWPIADLLCGFQWLAGLALGAVMTMRGEISLGSYLAFNGMIIFIIWPMRHLGRIIVRMSRGLASFSRVKEILKQEREPLLAAKYSPKKEITGDIEFDNVSFEYKENIPVLKEISFGAKSGQMVALLGPPGSGKTTLVNLLPRFYDYTGGRLLLDGRELKDYPRYYLRRHIGIVEQEPFLFSRTIKENITYGVQHEVSDEEVERAARFAAIHDVVCTFPKAYDTIVGERGVTLSGGQKQRVAIARTLLKNPEILILDDSTSAVDMETEVTIRKALEKLMKGRTTFVIAHRIQSLMKADLILVLDGGRIVQRGVHSELVSREGFYRKVYSMQSRIEDELEKDVSDAAL
jgi:ATP-binding cassette subfamily B protein